MEKIELINSIETLKDVFGVKIEATAKTYSEIDNQIMLWKSKDTYYCLWGDNMTVSGEPCKEFVKLISPKTVLCSSDKLNLKAIQKGEVLVKKIDGNKKEIPCVYFDRIKEVYELLKDCSMKLDYEGFMLDTLLKLRRGQGLISTIIEDGKIVAVALCSYITSDYAIVTAIATKKEYRYKGLGRKVLQELENGLSGRTLYLLKEENENDIFYNKMNYNYLKPWFLFAR